MQVPKNIGSDNVDAAHFYFNNLIFPVAFIITGKMEFSTDAEKRLTVLFHIIVRKTNLLTRRIHATQLNMT
ncbi:hypothetical protein D3C81_1777130 [compost metagenome]